MSSVQSFLRQRVVGTRQLSADDLANLYVLVAGSGNYVGNYPPGYMVKVDASQTIIGAGKVLRDMGKTVKAGISADGGATVGTHGFFRAIQVLVPTTVANATSSTNFGVVGSVPGTLPAGNPGDMGYATYYIPEVLGGVLASENGSALTTPVTQNSARLIPDGQL